MILLTVFCVVLCLVVGFLVFRLYKANRDLLDLNNKCTKMTILNDSFEAQLKELSSEFAKSNTKNEDLKNVNENLANKNEEYLDALNEGRKVMDLALKYEEFYNSTIGDIGQIVDTVQGIIGKRQMLSDDSDVQNLVRLLAIAHDTLLGYINAKLPSEQLPTTEPSQDTKIKQY